MSAHKDRRPARETAGTPADAHVETAGVFDIRNVIGLLVGLFGVILVVMGLFSFTAAEAEKTGGVNANLWAGLAMVAFALAVVVWTRLAPIRMVIQDDEDGAGTPRDITPLD